MLFHGHSDFYNKYKKLARRSSLRTFTPIHAGSNQYLPHSFNELFKFDLSELDGLDDLHNPESFILEAQRKASKLFQVEQTFFSVNGASACLMAACLSLGEGGKVLVPMNAHKSLLSGLILSGAEPVWYEPEWDAKWGIYKNVDPQKIADLIQKTENLKACFVTSPTYEGFQTKLGAIVDICHEKEIPVIVDESHGAHISLMGGGSGAVDACADLIIHSPHKSLGSLTQTGMLHLQSELLNPKKVEACMSLLQTTSPSFILLLSLIETIEQLKKDLSPLHKQRATAEELRYQLSKIEGIEFLNNDDPTRLALSLEGWSGDELSDWMIENHSIETELEGNRWVMFLIGLGMKSHQIRSLARALSKAHAYKSSSLTNKFLPVQRKAFLHEGNPRGSFLKAKEPKIEFQCPPGVPTNFPGYQTSNIKAEPSLPSKPIEINEDLMKIEKLKTKFASAPTKSSKVSTSTNSSNPYFEEVYDDSEAEFDQTFIESELEEFGTIHTLESLRAMEAKEA